MPSSWSADFRHSVRLAFNYARCKLGLVEWSAEINYVDFSGAFDCGGRYIQIIEDDLVTIRHV